MICLEKALTAVAVVACIHDSHCRLFSSVSGSSVQVRLDSDYRYLASVEILPRNVRAENRFLKTLLRLSLKS